MKKIFSFILLPLASFASAQTTTTTPPSITAFFAKKGVVSAAEAARHYEKFIAAVAEVTITSNDVDNALICKPNVSEKKGGDDHDPCVAAFHSTNARFSKAKTDLEQAIGEMYDAMDTFKKDVERLSAKGTLILSEEEKKYTAGAIEEMDEEFQDRATDAQARWNKSMTTLVTYFRRQSPSKINGSPAEQ